MLLGFLIIPWLFHALVLHPDHDGLDNDVMPPLTGSVLVLGMFALWPWLQPLRRRGG
ncbi:hypothetical protein [Streptodolium elevatio]|uniref:Uncharacterized protein n=1 Tax=Streptodolium elevatio TaxID=3157996 RepID=A0ABV3DJ09_9ACTN